MQNQNRTHWTNFFYLKSIFVALVFLSSLPFVLPNGSSVSASGAIFDKHVVPETTKDSIYLRGELLKVIQMARLHADSKDFVDRPTKVSLAVLKGNFSRLQGRLKKNDNPEASRRLIRVFVEENFSRTGTDPLPVVPPDWKEAPPLLMKIKDTETRKWALEIHKKWKTLFRSPSGHRGADGTVSSFIPPKGRYFIVPGGRFREFFYWDTYWMIKGLIASGMFESVKELLLNFYGLIEDYGYIPNGSREYFISRSQPPLLTMMVDTYTKKCMSRSERKTYLQEKIMFLEKEYLFWMSKRRVDITKGKEKYVLNIYNSDLGGPRPEAYYEDTILGEMVAEGPKTQKLRSGVFSEEEKKLFKHISAAAESGWDFSSRWIQTGDKLEIPCTADIIPVDLQAFLFNSERILAEMWEELGNKEKAAKYRVAMEQRKKAMNLFLWDKESFIWRDFNFVERKFQRKEIYSSCFYPLYFGAFYHPGMAEKAFVEKFLEKHLPILLKPGGIVASNFDSSQQWDYPNAWAIDQDLFVSFLFEKHYGDKKLRSMALDVSRRWIKTTYMGWKKEKGHLFEKYNGTKIGAPGGKGEYVVQDGFGWTNGVILHFLVTLGDEVSIPKE